MHGPVQQTSKMNELFVFASQGCRAYKIKPTVNRILLFLRTERTLIALLLCLSCFPAFGQIHFRDGHLFVRPYFSIGEQRYYKVIVHTKVDSSPLFPVNCSQEFTVSFSVLDTVKGYRVKMNIVTDSVLHNRMNAEAIKAQVLDGAKVYLRISTEGDSISIENMESLRQGFNNALDYFTSGKALDAGSRAVIRQLRILLHDNSGVIALLDPLLSYLDMYGNIFRKQKDYRPTSKLNLVGAEPFHGVKVTQLLKGKKGQADNVARLGIEYIGNREHAARLLHPLQKEMLEEATGRPVNDANMPTSARMDTDRIFVVYLDSGWPKSVDSKSIHFYITKVITTVRFSEIPELSGNRPDESSDAQKMHTNYGLD